GRSEDNSLYESRGTASLIPRSGGPAISATAAYRELLESGDEDAVKRLVAETRMQWVQSCVALLERITVPTILLWFSKREPRYHEEFTDVRALFGEFPQLVNAEMIRAVRPHASEYVECVTTRGLPQILVSRFTGRQTGV